MSRPEPSRRADYRWFKDITTRWSDNDSYGHLNNVVYYALFDTAVNAFLIERGLLDINSSDVIGIVAETGCRYISQIAYPDAVTVGIRVAHLGRSSVRYEAAVFREDEDIASAEGRFVHVYVDRKTMRPVEIPEAARAEMAKLQLPA